MERSIGDPGQFLNGSVATRAVNLEPDMRRVRRYDIYHRRYRNLLKNWGAAGLALLVAGVALCWFEHPIWGSILIVLSLPVLFIAARLPQTLKGDAYRNGLLIPGLITNITPLTMLCVTDIRTSGEEEEDETESPGAVFWGAKEVVIEQLPLHPAQLGEQVPCVSLFGGSDDEGEYYLNFEPRPLAWGTDSISSIEQARAAIDDEEWLLLPLLARAYASAEKNEDGVAYFDADLNPLRVAKAEAAPAAPEQTN
ncbi:DUF3239 domain-containing protein [Hymenobacter sediminis]|uniref:DUF3239 domain-containing protein n=1 Tax=Hymenobacter sediminis TaxID=2218621 RepID=UPI000DA6A3D6|nr:DUF3239 domain-containing protein [Hymenobacter sediminis]RPD47019.1 DUF3239 domain-containing protein [Hymenobacter sediminis]